MNLSLNEIEATAKRATRGAGYSWGQAEEAGKATRWLCAQGLDGAGILARLLALGFATDPANHRPQQLDGRWRAEGDLCPLSVGPLLSDTARLLDAGAIEMQPVVAPALLLPFVSNAARIQKCALQIEFDSVQAVTDGARLYSPDDFPDKAQRVTIKKGAKLDMPREHQSRAHPTPTDWDALNQFAHHTYAPATEESRLLGAGAGLSDND
ncbi:DUF3726 domain-containing protein [Ruegeria sp. R14_0]|uniref:DUF3726 domain-containing protein n=1 Tax=Ruegeria sp. R14_0 TaxID=2821100 RepID=UPI001ADA92AD|nr:DUF3726 domain-containing protein [Ruegeria sp. R14_0]MBO9447364.1 DUF3726 domain-containing protein [Ruegeria sp. R14_0]